MLRKRKNMDMSFLSDEDEEDDEEEAVDN